MGIDELIQAAVKPIVPICVPKQYGGDATEYCVYNYTEIPDNFGDDAPEAIRYLVQVHWFFPWTPNVSASTEVLAKKRALRQALAEAGLTWPSITPAGDSEWEHFTFECEYADGEV